MVLPQVVDDITAHFLGELDARFPGRLNGFLLHGSICWGESFAGSDVDFVAVWDRLPADGDLDLLDAAHAATRDRFSTPAFDGFHCTAEDLRAAPAAIASRPVHFGGGFDPEGGSDINPVTWHELAERPVVVRGEAPVVHTDILELVDFTRNNLDTYWRDISVKLEAGDPAEYGPQDDAVGWVTLGAARLHHLLTRHEITSKSGAGRYVCEALDPQWERIGREALRVRENPDTPSLYDDPAERGRDVRDLLAWLIQSGAA